MKYAIITPTFKPHFGYIDKYLKSYDKFVIDKDKIEIIFTISKSEKKDFCKILKKYPNIPLKVVYFEDLLQKFNIPYTCEELLSKYKKFTFQTFKKFLTMLDSEDEYFLVLDSESMWIKPTYMQDMFKNFFANPFICGSNIEKTDLLNNFKLGVIENRDFLIVKKCNKWFLENFVWFYDKKILLDLFSQYGSLLDLADKIQQLDDPVRIESGIFEIELYQAFIYANIKKYKYTFVDADLMLNNSLTQSQIEKYTNKYYTLYRGSCGLLEQAMVLLSDDNVKKIAEKFKESRFNIIRCDYSDIDNYLLQRQFLDIVQPNILAASQAHAFGVNNVQIILLKQTKYYQKLCKHTKKFADFMGNFLEPFSILFYAFRFLLYLPKFYRKYISSKIL